MNNFKNDNNIYNKKIFSPTEINSLINEIFNIHFEENIEIEGELTNIKKSNLDHLYFSLKDEKNGIINGVFWKSSLKYEAEKFKKFFLEGSKIIISGRISVYNNKIQIIGHSFIQINKEGYLFLEFEKIKQKLAKEGVFDPLKKKKIPRFPEKICIITSKHGSVIHDMINRIKARFDIEVNLIPVSVQGPQSVNQIVKAIKVANKKSYSFDLIILARGGGSFEDLFIFNDESIVNEIFHSKVPIISAIGHETDFTLSDFASDLRAPTPSSSIDICLEIKENIQNSIRVIISKIYKSILYKIKIKENYIDALSKNFSKNIIELKLDNQKSKALSIIENIKSKINFKISKIDSKIQILLRSIENFNHINILKRGYNICFFYDIENNCNKIIRTSKDFKEYIAKKKDIKLQFSDETIDI
jgi:exodeoxyribonuclease VII large subunit